MISTLDTAACGCTHLEQREGVGVQVPEAYDSKYQQRKAWVELRARSADGAVQPLIEGRLGDSGAEGLPGDAR